MELPPQALPADDGVVIHGVVVVGKRGMGTLVHVCGVVKVIPFPVRHDGDLTDHTQKSGSVMLQPPIPVNQLQRKISSTMMSTTLTCVSACVLLILAPTAPVQGKSLLAIMSKQAEALQHGLDLASKVGDIGSRTYGVAFTAVPSSTTIYSSGSIIKFNKLKYNQGNGFNTGNYRFTAPAAGMYVFSWSLAIGSSYYGQSKLMKNGSTYHQTHCQKTYQQCGATVTMWLNKGGQVWVASDASSIYVYATYSSFSGWKIN